MCCRPAASVLHSVERYVVGNAHRLTPKDVKDFLVAFTAMEAPPDAEMVNASILQLPKNFQDTLPKDLATLITVRSHGHIQNLHCVSVVLFVLYAGACS